MRGKQAQLFPAPLAAPPGKTPSQARMPDIPLPGLSSAVVGAWIRFGGAYHALQFRGRGGVTAFCGRLAAYEEVVSLRPPSQQPRKVCNVCLDLVPGAPAKMCERVA
jgi:hypothetical protein